MLTRIWLVDATPGLRVLATRVAGPDRKRLFVASDPKWPSDGVTDLHPVEGFRVAPLSTPDGDRGVELVFAVTPASQPKARGCPPPKTLSADEIDE